MPCVSPRPSAIDWPPRWRRRGSIWSTSSARHAGHAGARPEGESHFRVTIVADAFRERSRIDRQRMVFAALGDLMRHDIHALAITALTPAEADARQQATARQPPLPRR